MSHINERWVAIDGSVYTEAERTRLAPVCGVVKYRPGIAYNVGQMVAEHIALVHNASLLLDLELDLPQPLTAGLLDAVRNPVHVTSARILRDADEDRAERMAQFVNMPPPFDSQEEAQRAAGIWPQEAEPATVRVPHPDVRRINPAPEPGLSSAVVTGMSIGVPDGATGVRVYVNGVLLHDSQAAAPGMSSVMQPQGSSLRPVEIGQAVVAPVPAPKPCCGCRKA